MTENDRYSSFRLQRPRATERASWGYGQRAVSSVWQRATYDIKLVNFKLEESTGRG